MTGSSRPTAAWCTATSRRRTYSSATAAWVIDWEVAHVGDPVFDLAFLLTYLVCKALHRPGDVAVLQRAADIFLACHAGITAEEFGPVEEG